MPTCSRWPGLRPDRRGSGRSRTGHTTAPHRRGVRRPSPLRTAPPPGVYRRWGRHPHGGDLLVGPAGAAGWAPSVEGAPEYTWVGYSPAPPTLGSTLSLRWTGVGAVVSGVGWLARARGSRIKLLRHRADHVECRLPSGAHRWVPADLAGTLGARADPAWRGVHHTRAGDSFVQGWRPHVRGVAMNPVDHPHGGGQGKTAGGGPGVTPWGRLTKGYRTVRS